MIQPACPIHHLHHQNRSIWNLRHTQHWFWTSLGHVLDFLAPKSGGVSILTLAFGVWCLILVRHFWSTRNRAPRTDQTTRYLYHHYLFVFHLGNYHTFHLPCLPEASRTIIPILIRLDFCIYIRTPSVNHFAFPLLPSKMRLISIALGIWTSSFASSSYLWNDSILRFNPSKSACSTYTFLLFCSVSFVCLISYVLFGSLT